ncbi:MAG TPA: VWA domain-containing protein [Terriglobales bacterium]|nr:VWA domain-containing protein [Terriglobales bacterium]
MDEIHVIPRASHLAANSHEAAIRVNASMVLVPVTITDAMNRVVTGLDQANFEVLENKRHQEIKHFSSQDEPVSLGIIFDMSTSMDNKIDSAREAVKKLLDTANPKDEFFLIGFADQPHLLVDFTSDTDKIQNQMLYMTPKGHTSLLDAVYLGVKKMHEARYARRALMIISDGGDNRSRYTEKDLRSLVKEADVLIYAAGIYDRNFATDEERRGPMLLNDLSTMTGAQCFVVDKPNQLPAIAKTIGIQLRSQYVLGYKPVVNTTGKSTWRKILVRLKLPKGAPRLGIFAKSGYYNSGR